MVIYLIPEVLLFLLTIFSPKLNIKKYKFCLKVICLLWIFIFGFRSVFVGNDTIGYVSFFLNKNSGFGYGNVNGISDVEPGFIQITRLIKCFSDSYTVWFLIIAAWLWTVIYCFYTTVSDYKRIAPSLLAIFLMSNAFVTMMVAMRQATAICVFFTGLILIIKNGYIDGKIKFLYSNKLQLIGALLLLLTMFIHKSMILIIPILLLASILKASKKYLTGILLASCLLAFLFSENIGAFFNAFFVAFGEIGINFVDSAVMNTYAEDFGGNTQKITTYVAWALPAFVAIRLSNEKDSRDIFFKLYILSVCIFLLFSTTFLIERINTTLMLLGFTRFWPIQAAGNTKWRFVYLGFLFLLLINTFIRYNNWPLSDTCIPYYFFWEK